MRDHTSGKTLLIRYFIAAYAFSWLVFVPLALEHQGLLRLVPAGLDRRTVIEAIHALGGLGPLLAALLVLRSTGTACQRAWYRRSWSPGRMTAASWLLGFSPLGLFAFALLVNTLVNGGTDLPALFRSQGVHSVGTFAFWTLPVFTYGIGEEAGWRGFALPLLQRERSPLKATLILGLLWALWHLPLFGYRFDLGVGGSIGFLIGVLCGAVLLTFVYNTARGAVLAVCCWHFTWNLVSTIDKNGFLSAFMSTVIMVVALFLVWKYRSRLSRSEQVVMPMEQSDQRGSKASAW
jgi:membrane protease YdiL (CAAX protease family)